MLDEAALIAKITAALPSFTEGLGIGDDAAVLQATGTLVVTTDLLLEDVDFTAATAIEHVMAKSFAANLSDVAAMGATPFAYLLTLGLTNTAIEQFDRLVAALAAGSREFGVQLIGGDLSRSEKLLVSITAFGRFASGATPLLRSAALPGHQVFVSRPLGGASAGLQLLRAGWTIDATSAVRPPEGSSASYSQREFARSALLRQLSPEPEVSLGALLAKLSTTGACIDVSDGLSTDLHRICRASRCGAVLERERIPGFPDLAANALFLGTGDPFAAVLHGGEEFALLFTSTLGESELSEIAGRRVYSIGRIVDGHSVVLQYGSQEEKLEPAGFDHFAQG
ncbi:MAG: thiamine-phosphate kinase [Acidobacteriota bacterium]